MCGGGGGGGLVDGCVCVWGGGGVTLGHLQPCDM